jgi:hypothetical protein
MEFLDSGDMSHVRQTQIQHRKRSLDWEQNRELILRLYVTEGRPLREVCQIMYQEYAFDAS